jgi:hypothetical protein
MNKHKSYSVFYSVVLFMQITFFDNDSKKQYKLDNFAAIFLILLLSLTLLFGYKFLDLHHEECI